jgi:hypothetical protein
VGSELSVRAARAILRARASVEPISRAIYARRILLAIQTVRGFKPCPWRLCRARWQRLWRGCVTDRALRYSRCVSMRPHEERNQAKRHVDEGWHALCFVAR